MNSGTKRRASKSARAAAINSGARYCDKRLTGEQRGNVLFLSRNWRDGFTAAAQRELTTAFEETCSSNGVVVEGGAW